MADESCVGVKNVTINEPFFQGHFPQLSGDAGRADHRGPGADGRRAVRATACGRATTSRSSSTSWASTAPSSASRCCRATSSIITCSKIRNRGRVWRFDGEAKVNGQVVAEAEISAMIAGSPKRAFAAEHGEYVHPTAIIEDGAKLGSDVRDRPLLRGRPRGRARRRRRAAEPRRGRRPHDHRRAHAHLSLRLDRPSAAGPQVQGRAVDAQRRRRLHDPRGRHA